MMKYQRVLLKVSGEALSGSAGFGIDNSILEEIAKEIVAVAEMGVEVAIVVGGGNIHRGVSGAIKGMDRASSDYMGMVATMLNALALQDCLERKGHFTRVQSAIDMREVSEPYIRRRAVRHLEKKRIVIFAAGTGNPYFTTDTTAALRANEIGADIILKATKVDGIYDKDPMENKDAVKYDQLTYSEVISQGLKVMDTTAVTLCMENQMKIVVFNFFEKDAFKRIIQGEAVGTLVQR